MEVVEALTSQAIASESDMLITNNFLTVLTLLLLYRLKLN